MTASRWANFPLPEGHIFSLVVGLALHRRRPARLSKSQRQTRRIGWPIFLLGILLALWSVKAVGDQNISQPSVIATTGPYAYSRNPMYMAWMAIYLGISFLVNSRWPFLFLPVVAVYTHNLVVRREEKQLGQDFGETYYRYCVEVRRYV